MRVVGKLLGMEIVEVDDLPELGPFILGPQPQVIRLRHLPPRVEPDGSVTFRMVMEESGPDEGEWADDSEWFLAPSDSVDDGDDHNP